MKKKSFLYFGLSLVAVILLNFLAQQFIFRVDLTEDQRYTISPATKKLLGNLEEEIYIKVYLKGEDLPAEFKRFQNAIEETLDEFQIYAGRKLIYRFIDPLNAEETLTQDSLLVRLAQRGIQPTNVVMNKDGKRTEKFIFPVATITYQDKEITTLLLKGDQRASVSSSGEVLNQSIENIEYELAASIKQLVNTETKNVGFLVDKTVLDKLEVADAWFTLNRYYKVFPVSLSESPNLQGLDAIIIAKPDTAFTEEDKYKVDQFIMQGGKALFFIDALDIREDSIRTQGVTPAIPYQHNLIDLFFRYGVRFNNNYIEDLNSGIIDLIVGYTGNVPKMESLPWRPYPIVNNFFDHPTVKNLDALYTRYVSTLDTVKTPSTIRKIPLVTTSPYTKVKPILEGISYNDARIYPTPDDYKEGALTIAYLLEGKFTSLYKGRLLPEEAKAKNFIAQSVPTKLLIFADGDLIRNDVQWRTGQYAPLGYDKTTGVQFGNKRFLLNVLEYMLDDEGIILARNKEVTLRPLDKEKVRTERTWWQVINLLLPVLIILLIGIIYYWVRRIKYKTPYEK